MIGFGIHGRSIFVTRPAVSFSAPAIGRFRSWIEWCRYLVDRVVLLPAADFLPKRAALHLAAVMGVLDAGMTGTGANWRRQFGRTHGLGSTVEGRATRWRCSQPYFDLILIRRVAKGRDNVMSVPIRQVGGDGLSRLTRSAEKQILSGGHFGYFAGVVMLSRVGAAHVGQAPAEIGATGPGLRRFALRDRNSREALACCAGVSVVPLDQSNAQTAARDALGLIRTLKRNEAHCVIAIDPPWDPVHALTRPWAGSAARSFPLGVERLAAAAQCDVTLVIPRLARDGVVEFHWGETHRVQEGDSRGTMTNRLLDELEPYVGRFPENYTLEIGGERRWDSTTNTWQDRQVGTTIRRE